MEMNDKWDYTPERWVVLHFPNDEIKYRLLAGWLGGYLNGDSWRLNSGIIGVSEFKDYVVFWGSSGSTYKCMRQLYGTTSLTNQVWKNIKKVRDENVFILDEDTIWNNLNFN